MKRFPDATENVDQTLKSWYQAKLRYAARQQVDSDSERTLRFNETTLCPPCLLRLTNLNGRGVAELVVRATRVIMKAKENHSARVAQLPRWAS
jgi:hypothetical protein